MSKMQPEIGTVFFSLVGGVGGRKVKKKLDKEERLYIEA